MASNNPYSRGYAAIQAAFAAWAPLTSLVKRRNLQGQDLQTPTYQPETNPSDTDRPRFTLTVRRLPIAPYARNSRHVAFSAFYDLRIPTGVYTVDLAGELVIEAARALMAHDEAEQLLGIGDILESWLIPDVAVRAGDAALGRATWTATMSVRLDFAMDRAAFLAADFT